MNTHSHNAITRRQGCSRWTRVRPLLLCFLFCFSNVYDAAALQKVGVFDPSSPPEIGPVGPEIDDGVNAAQDFSVSSSNPTSVGLRWFNKGAPQTRVIRSVNHGPWETLATFGELPLNQYVAFLDSNAAADAENCYVIIVSDGFYNSLSTPQRCYITRDGRDLPVHRLQLRIRVPDISGAATDNDVEVRLQSPSWLVPAVTNWRPAGNSTWIDSTKDDFGRGSDRTYDLMLSNVSQASDITMITVSKTGDDNLCVAELELLIDGQTAYQQTYGDTAETCVWLTADDSFSVTFDDLRDAFEWISLGLPTFTGIDGEALASRIEATFGHKLHGTGALRNGSMTTSQRLSESRLEMSVPIVVYDVSWGPIYLGDVDSTVYFDLVLTQTADNLGNPVTKLSVEDVDADSSDLLAVILPLAWPVLYGVSSEIESQVADFEPVDISPSPIAETHPCFTPDGGIGICFDTSYRRQIRAGMGSFVGTKEFVGTMNVHGM